MPCPLRKTPSDCAQPASQSSALMTSPVGVSQTMSSRPPEPAIGRPWKYRRRWKIGCSRRSLVSVAVKPYRKEFSRTSLQSTHEISLSWQYALLLPPWVRPISSPATSIGTPCDRNSVVRKLRFCCSRRATTSRSSVGPSTPQFQDRFVLSPSRLSSPVASLCLSL